MTMTADNNNEQPLAAAAAVAAVTAAVTPTPTAVAVADVDNDNETPGTTTTTTEDDNNNNAEEHIPLITMSKHLSNQIISPLLDPDLDVSIKIEKAEKLKPFLDEIDGYWSFSSEEEEEDDPDNNSDRRHSRRGGPTKVAITEGHLPILEWNTNFRKSYTILLWVRPKIGSTERKEDTTTTTIAEDDELLKNKNKSKNKRRILYRFANHEHDSQSKSGVCVSVGDWRAIVEDSEEESSTVDLSQRKKKKKNRKLITTLTAYSLPYEPPDMEKIMAGGLDSAEFDPAPFVTAPLELIENEWSFIGITHVFPYLKRPHWTICVNGKTTASGELAYPQLGGVGNRGESTSSSSVMNYNTLFSNITSGGCEMIKTNHTDCNKKASDLQQNIYNNVNPKYNLTLQLASFCVCNEVFTPTIQALLAQAGPIMSIQSYGSLPQLPPVANWSKGSSLEGPNVGIPLVVSCYNYYSVCTSSVSTLKNKMRF